MASAVGMIEVYGLVAAFAACDAGCKAADVTVEPFDKNKPAHPDGLPVPLQILVKFRGSVSDVNAAIEAADIVLMNDNLEKISDAVALSKRTRSIVIQNIAFALSVKALALILGALGVVGLGVAIFADVGVAVIAILNSMRNLK